MHYCASLCIRLVSDRVCRTEFMDAQLTVFIVSVVHEYLFIMYAVIAGVRCASYIAFL